MDKCPDKILRGLKNQQCEFQQKFTAVKLGINQQNGTATTEVGCIYEILQLT